MILLHELIGAGYEVCLMTMSESNQPEPYPFQVLRKPSLREQIKWFAWADLVFENNPVLKLSWLNLWFRRPRITAVHTWILQAGQPKSRAAKIKHWWLKKASQVIMVSKALQREILPQSSVVPNPYQNELFRIDPTIEKNKSFVFLGRIVSDKGLKVAIEALHLLLESMELAVEDKQKLELSVIGKGPQEEELQHLIQKLGINEKVHFLGMLKESELVYVLNQHQFLLVPSLWEEPFGMVALEGMACGCIPIVSNSGGLPEAIGEAGLLFEKGNSNALAKQLLKLIKNPDLQSGFRLKAQKHLKKHTASYIAKQYIEHIDTYDGKRPQHSTQ